MIAFSSVRTFSEPAEYGAAIRAGQFDVTVLERGAYFAKLVRIDLDRLWMQRFSENLPRIARVATSPTRAIVSFSTGGTAPQQWGGREISPASVIRIGAGEDVFQRSSGPAHSASMSLPVDDFARAVAAVTHRDVGPRDASLTIRPQPQAIANLKRLHAGAAMLAEQASAVLAEPEASRALEQQLVLAMIECVSEPAEEDSLALRHHQAILRRFRAVIEANVGNPLYLPEICAELGVSNRTLQRCCHEQLGVSPLRYLWLRRMHMVRRALMAAAPGPRAVTTIATGYGFWELGRFSVGYRTLFGEPPSATLKRPPGFSPQGLSQFA